MKEQEALEAAAALCALRYLASDVRWEPRHQAVFNRVQDQISTIRLEEISPEAILNYLDMKYAQGTMQ